MFEDLERYFEWVPYDPWRQELYSTDELDADGLDERIYEHMAQHRSPGTRAPMYEALAQRVHDHAIDDALGDTLERHDRVVAVMGGHALRRSDPTFEQVAVLSHRLAAAGYYLATGGGPGAMEAANLGAACATGSTDDLAEAITHLRAVDGYDQPGYRTLAREVRDDLGEPTASLAIPTWFYGHEPTNWFATDVAKYFSNSIREDGLLAIATHGVVYTPGMAGTVQEVFMDATQNHYRVFGFVSPMVFLGRSYWNETLPVIPLVEALAEGRDYRDLILVTDDIDEAAAFIDDHPPR